MYVLNYLYWSWNLYNCLMEINLVSFYIIEYLCLNFKCVFIYNLTTVIYRYYTEYSLGDVIDPTWLTTSWLTVKKLYLIFRVYSYRIPYFLNCVENNVPIQNDIIYFNLLSIHQLVLYRKKIYKLAIRYFLIIFYWDDYFLGIGQ